MLQFRTRDSKNVFEVWAPKRLGDKILEEHYDFVFNEGLAKSTKTEYFYFKFSLLWLPGDLIKYSKREHLLRDLWVSHKQFPIITHSKICMHWYKHRDGNHHFWNHSKTTSRASGEISCQKIRQRTALGWKEVHEEFSKQPFCHNRQQLVRLIMCLECSYCRWEGFCYPCFNQGIEHKLFYTPPIENITLVKMCSDTFDWSRKSRRVSEIPKGNV